jgi:ribosomal protein L16 Arg81 hydroxylase
LNADDEAAGQTRAPCAQNLMQAQPLDLVSLLHPLSVDTFLATHWEKSFLWVPRGVERYYAGLLTDQNLEDLISSPDARYPAVRLAKAGVYYSPQTYCDDVKVGHVTFSGVPNLKKLSAEYAKGATLALTSLDRSWRPLSDLCIRLEEQLDHGVNTNVYLTAGRTSGFPPHYDTHDILVLQIAGQKLWRIYEPTISLPDPTQPCDPKGYTPGPLLAQVQLSAGDLLYLPRGFGHAASTLKSHSAHVTIGVRVYTWGWLLKEWDPSGPQREELRKSLPPGFASRAELRPALKEHLKRLAPGRVTDANFDRIFDSIVRNVNQLRRRPPARFRADASVISPDSRLQILPENRYQFSRLVDSRNTVVGLALDLDGNRFTFPAQLDAVLSTICSRGRLRLNELAGGSSHAGILELAGYLQTIGFVTVID